MCLKTFCAIVDITHEKTLAYAPHQNGVTKQKNMSLLERAQSMTFACDALAYLWSK